MTYPEDTLTTFAAIRNINQTRVLQAGTDALIDSKEVYLRYAANREEITKDWLIVHKGIEHIIGSIENVDMGYRLIKLVVKAKTGGLPAAGISTGGGTVGGEPVNFTEFYYANNVVTFTGGSNTGATEVMVVGVASVTLATGQDSWGLSLNPDTYELRWRKTGQTEWSSGYFVVDTMSATTLRLYPLNGITDDPDDYFDFPVEVYNNNLVRIGTAADLDEYQAIWNADPINSAMGQITAGSLFDNGIIKFWYFNYTPNFGQVYPNYFRCAPASAPVFELSASGTGVFSLYSEGGAVTADWGDGSPVEVTSGKYYEYTGPSIVKLYHHNLPTLLSIGDNSVNFSGFAGALPTGLQRLALFGHITELPALPATIKSLSLEGNNLTAAIMDTLIDSLVANGLTGGLLDLRYQYTSEVPTNTTGIETLRSRGWEVKEGNL